MERCEHECSSWCRLILRVGVQITFHHVITIVWFKYSTALLVNYVSSSFCLDFAHGLSCLLTSIYLSWITECASYWITLSPCNVALSYELLEAHLSSQHFGFTGSSALFMAINWSRYMFRAEGVVCAKRWKSCSSTCTKDGQTGIWTATRKAAKAAYAQESGFLFWDVLSRQSLSIWWVRDWGWRLLWWFWGEFATLWSYIIHIFLGVVMV